MKLSEGLYHHSDVPPEVITEVEKLEQRIEELADQVRLAYIEGWHDGRDTGSPMYYKPDWEASQAYADYGAATEGGE